MARVLMVASEATPFCKTGGLADVMGALPAALAARGEQVAVVIPAYRGNFYPSPPREVWRRLWLAIGPGFLADIYEVVERGVQYFFVDCPPLYDRDGLYGWHGSDHFDNHTRFAALSMAAIGVARHLFRADVIHCHDWQAALTPVFIRHFFYEDPTFYGTRLLFTIHNLRFQGNFGKDVLPYTGLGWELFHAGALEFYDRVNFMKGGIAFSDAISTVSPTYAREIQTPEYGEGLDGFLRERSDRIYGIVNGVDYEEWNPETDPRIARNYSIQKLDGKLDCKRALLAEFGFPPEAIDRPLIGIISRFDAYQKGFDLIADIIWALTEQNVSVIALGAGDHNVESLFNHVTVWRPEKFKVWIGMNPDLAHRIEAGADIFLMPSRYEPCGLNQIYSLRYGTVPVVRATGGLDDTIDKDTGFKFWDYSGGALLGAVLTALGAFQEKKRWTEMMRCGMRKDFSWKASAAEYSGLYRRLLER